MYQKRLDRVMRRANTVLFDDSSKFIIMSDCHRGDDSHSDTFSKNQNIYFTALSHYLRNGFTYIELGDGDELWKNKGPTELFQAHGDAFWLLSEFYRKNRLYMLYGNHDIVKKKQSVRRQFYQYKNHENKDTELFPDIEFYEGLILSYLPSDEELFLFHGHQVDLLNSSLWRLARFLVRFFWRPLENFGVTDPTSAAKNTAKMDKLEKRISDWAEKKQLKVITGHTHRPRFPTDGTSYYFNDGSCVHPRCITGIEIERGTISLIKWSVKANSRGCLCVERELLAGPLSLGSGRTGVIVTETEIIPYRQQKRLT